MGAIVFASACGSGESPQRQARQVPAPVIVKQPVQFASHTFDPANPPAEMPPLPAGENAECDSNFISNASVSGQPQRIDATHATVTITQIKVTLQLDINVWVPADVTQHVIEHEQGHRQISEHYYETADQLAQRLAASYMGRQIPVSGDDLDAASRKALQDAGAEITDEYSKELNSNAAQLLYDSITDHSRNEVVYSDAVAHALKNVAIESPQPASADPSAN
jgi:hypothetical protein